LEQNLKIIR